MITPEPSLARSKILIIDDETEVVQILHRLLSSEGYENIQSTTDPLVGLQLFRDFKPDIVILDWLMPQLAGSAVLAALRTSIPAETVLPILVVTGDTSIETRRAALQHGASDFIAKPYDCTEILARVANLLRARAAGFRKAELAVAETVDRFSTAFEHAPIGVAMVSAEGRWLRVNHALCSMVGYTEAELLARTFAEISHPESMGEDLDHAQRMLAGEFRSYQREKRYLHKDGHLVTVLLNVSVVRDTDTTPLYFVTQIQDITERKRHEIETRDSRRFLRSVLDALSSHIAILDENGVVIEVNEAWRRFAAKNDYVPRLRGLGDNYLLLCDAATGPFSREAPLVAAGIRAVMAGTREEYHCEYPCHGGEEKRWFVVRVTRFEGEGPIRVVVAHENVTERKEAEEALRASEANMAAAQRIAHFASWEMELRWVDDPYRNRVSWSDEMFRIAGYEPHSVKVDLALFFSLVPLVEHKAIWLEIEAAIRERRGYSIVHRLTRPSGEERIIHETAEIVYDSDSGQPLKFIGTAHDITEERRIKEELFRSRATLRSILDQIPQRVFWKDRESVYLGCNLAFAADGGLRNPEEIVGKTDHDMRWHPMAELYRADDRMVMEADAGKLSYEEPGVASEGAFGWVRTSKSPLHDSQGRVTGVLGTYEDVTEHKRAKLEIERLNADLERRVEERTADLLAATLEAQRANQAKGEFLSRVSHELRTPLNAILGFGQLLEMEGSLVGDPREYVEHVLAAGKHLLTLVNEVLDISSARAGHLTFALEAVDVAPLLQEALRLAHQLPNPLRVKIAAESLSVGEHRVLADPRQLGHALGSLFSNAIKYNRPDGSVTVSCIALPAELPTVLRIAVRDTGAGIAPESLGRLFAPFDRLDAERARQRTSGTGLGLTLSKALVEMMGGQLGVESTLGQGSVFWIEMPVAADAPPSEAADRA